MIRTHRWYHDYDYYYVGGDDVYLLPSNLLKVLSTLDPSQPIYLGRPLTFAEEDLIYHSGGAGYVLSREALRLLVDEGLESSFCWPKEEVWLDQDL